MNKRLLIANRGEIAIRIMRTAKKMGFVCAVLQSDKEPEALYLKMADEIIPANDSLDEKPIFLNAQKIIDLSLAHQIDLIHPGYGFLSENPDFAQLCGANNINFVGPSHMSIRNMGLKPIAKEMAMKAGLPLIKGSGGVVDSAAEAVTIAEEIGYPVLIKASAGGGGRGMRVVDKPQAMERHFKSAHNEALTAFGNGDLFIEKYITNPKHIEFQMLGDKFGNVVHLGERECSLQRKHQKMIEEAPSPALSQEKRQEIGDKAVRFAKSINYFSAGTIEFLLDEDGSYYFMEMNTRIQVEHPVTEMITGIDIVEWQFKIALDEKLTLKQEDIKLKGWSIECRVNAEDGQSRFSPETGYVEKAFFPEAEDVRIETGITDGGIITPYFDSMVAKIIVYGDDRESAIKRTIEVLEETIIVGPKTTIPFYLRVLKNPDFVLGTYTTRWMADNYKPEMLYDENEELIGVLVASLAYSSDFLKFATDEPICHIDSLNTWKLRK